MRTVARIVAADPPLAERLETRLLLRAEYANEPEWRGRATVAYLLEHMADAQSKARPPSRTRERPTISLEPSETSRAIDEAVDAVLGADIQLYQRNLAVIQIAGSRDVAKMQVVEVSADRLNELMGNSAYFRRQGNTPGKWMDARCPAEFGKMYLARRGIGWNLPTLAAVIHSPTMLADGRIIDMPGYDQRTGLYFDDAGQNFRDVPHEPSRTNAESAAELLETLLAEFPFVDDVDRSVAMAAILTAACRRGLKTAPMFAFTAPAPGSGKSYLIDIVSLVGTGSTAAGLSFSGDDNENRKTIDAALVDGSAMLVFDNVSREVAGDRLNQIITQSEISLRILGQTKNVTVPCGAMVMVNGNSLSIAADMTRRTLLCRLDAGVERPEQRPFANDPVETLRIGRGDYLAAALTVLRAYHVNGRPDCPPALGSFSEWSDLVRGALLWLGFADPVASMEHVRANDPRRSEHLAVMEAWNTALGNERVSTRRIIDAAISGNPDFREALLAVAGAAGSVDTGRLGRWLRSNKDKLAGGMKICAAGTTGGATVWRLEGGNVVPMLPSARAEESGSSAVGWT